MASSLLRLRRCSQVVSAALRRTPASAAVVRAPAARLALTQALLPSSERFFCSHPDFQAQSNVEGSEDDEVQQKLKKLVSDNKVVLFMKGSPDAPQCGFSRTVAQILNMEECDDYAYVDVLKYPEVREGVKKFSDWPTIPQLYVNGEFLGGCDIVTQMHREGELKESLSSAKSK
eukprot:TRINITY_DN101561_c0_g1_i1.p2 TRINITY_DN101561_c0_g1~~TRINITY_DN101561_c0_g1_i1.p2  ORF type:complete len:174 (-),score=54.19 TRINITY_DN101561_c0_g1_i1:158-679(-)